MRYDVIYRVLRRAISPFMRLRYGFRTDLLPEQEEPFLLLSNHTTEDDMFFTALAVRQPMTFVCGEHLLRNRTYGALLRKVFSPIPIPKGGSTVPAVMRMIKRLRAGENLCLFYEGKRSYHGETIPAARSLGALVKKAGCGLVTYRIIGGYFTRPRWAGGNKRRGHVEGKVVGVYSSAQLAELSAEEVTALINRDTYENAYRTQREKHWVYRGKNRAEGLESVLFLCPTCGGEDTIRTKGSRFFCERCGLAGEVDLQGFLAGSSLPYDNVLDWMRWIEGAFDDRVRRSEDGALLSAAEDVTLFTRDENYTDHTVCTDRLEIFRDRLEIGGRSFAYADVPYMSVLYGNILLLTCRGVYYGLKGSSLKAWKCARLWQLEKGLTHDKTKEI